MNDTSATTSITLITGAARGIGAATALLLARRGHDLAINYRRDEAAAEALARQIRGLGRRAITVRADVARPDEVEALFSAVDAGLGRLTGLVNNAGIVAPRASLAELSRERVRHMFEVNVFGLIHCTQLAAERMSRSRDGRGGAIVNLSSRAAQRGSAHMYSDYAASKGAVDTLTLSLGHELIAEGIRVNGVRPGIIETDIHADSLPPGTVAERLAEAAQGIPIGRLGTAEEIAEAIAWLLSDASSYTVGATLDVAGGR
ncbi:SDR family oxidoreductase [Roseateles chitosanitabidus]|uniref:SDR family oxidoreductase n=1 Tax=Roseateles chitosanitabidus TaxID=65048 RepID=UPI000A961071|nr:SDR family oxidoreductase [Roseateles chitosanitabidus]